ncbi:MAG: MarR family transcriptional regulator [Lachnospiraceae bacterium]|nr:MarR family transcriptional regulator [Lachnospiraceae bacterium]
MSKYDSLKIENQLCFPLYAAAKEVVRQYKPFLDRVGLTYTQYITMMILWEAHDKFPSGSVNVKTLGARLFLDSGTLTPLLKKLEIKGIIERSRSSEDERNVLVQATEKGMLLREQCISIPQSVGSCIPLTPEESATLYGLLHKILGSASV